MRPYLSPAAFRTAVDTRLRHDARRVGVPVQVLRRQAALERLMARLTRVAPARWALKGGLALETRLGNHARASMDMDIDHIQGMPAAREDLLRAAAEDLGDHFAFALAGATDVREGDQRLATRFRFESSVAGVHFESLQVDVTRAAPAVWQGEPAQRPGRLAQVGLGPIEVLLIPLERQVAEKVHAYTRRYNGESTRVRDLVDLVLVRLFGRVKATRLIGEIRSTFEQRATHSPPQTLPLPPPAWARAFAAEAQALGLPTTLDEGYRLCAAWLDPVLRGTAQGIWDPKHGRWPRA